MRENVTSPKVVVVGYMEQAWYAFPRGAWERGQMRITIGIYFCLAIGIGIGTAIPDMCQKPLKVQN